MEAGNALKAVHGMAEILRSRDLQNREVVANSSCPVPDEIVYPSQFRRICNNFVEQIITCLAEDMRFAKIRRQLFLDSCSCSPELFNHLRFHCWGVFCADSWLACVLIRRQRECRQAKCWMCTHLLFRPDIVLCSALHALKLRAHVRTRCGRCQGL